MRHAEPREQAAQDVARLFDALPGLRAAVDLAATADAQDRDQHQVSSSSPDQEQDGKPRTED